MHEIDIVIWKFVEKIVCALHACDEEIDSIYVDLHCVFDRKLMT
jgi:hypothetical protein